MRGYLESATPERITGWAFAEDKPDYRVKIAIYDGEQCLAVVVADNFRPDLITTSKSDGRHGFSLSIPPGTFPLPIHVITARVHATGLLLHGPRLVQCSNAAGNSPGLGEWLEKRVGAVAAGARVAGDLDRLVDVLTNSLSIALSRQAEVAEGTTAVFIEHDGQKSQRANLPDFLKDMAERVLGQCDPLWVPVSIRPELSIVIALTGNVQVLHACLKAVLDNRPSGSFEVIVVDGSNLAETALLPFIFGPGARTVRVRDMAGTTQLWACGARLARGKRFLFLDETIHVEAGTIALLAETTEIIGKPAIIGPRLRSPNGRVLEAGAHLGALGQRSPRGYASTLADPAFRRLTETDDLAHGIVMMSRDSYKAFGGFSETHAWGDLGLTEMSLRARTRGVQVFTQGCALATRVADPSASTKALTSQARRAFVEHYAADIAALNDQRRKKRPKALIFDSVWPDPMRDAASQVVIDHARALQALGYDVEFSAFQALSTGIDPALSALKWGLEAYGPDLFETPLAHLDARKAEVDLIYIHRLAASEVILDAVKSACPAAKVIFNPADLHFLRKEREASLKDSPELLREAAALKALEIDAIGKCDVVLTHSQPEAEIIRALLPAVRVGVLGWSFRPASEPLPFAKRHRIAFVGGFLHKPNVDAVLHFVETVFPLMRAKLPDVDLVLVGSHMPPEIAALARPGLIPAGFRSDLQQLLSGIRLTIAPLRYGAGVKGKVLGSLAAGAPCIMSPIAAEGIPLDGPLAPLVVETPEEWIAALVTYYHDETLWGQASQAGLELIGSRYSTRVIKEGLHAMIAGLEPPAQDDPAAEGGSD
jgi:O-antigen biosynthesis protein